MKKLLVIAGILISGLLGFVISQSVPATSHTFFSSITFLNRGGNEAQNPGLFATEIQFETATCYVMSNKSNILDVDSLDNFMSLGCIKN